MVLDPNMVGHMHTWTFSRMIVQCLILVVSSQRTSGQTAYQEPFYKGATEAKLSEGGYEGVVVAINPQVEEDPDLIPRITKVLSDFSEYLYEVTRQQTYLKEVRILIPTTWAENSSYESAVSERFEESDIRIDLPSDEGNIRNRNLPYTNKPTFCGSQGFYIHLTPEYLKDVSIALLYGSYEKVLAHEWAHYRWGVFDEYPRPQSNDPHFYQASSGMLEGVRCTTEITGQQRTADGDLCIIPPDGIPDDSCRFHDARKSSPKTASLMYKQFLDQVTEYCDDDERDNSKVRVRHNAEAPNHHNIQCAGRSVWQVMREHSDFSPLGVPVTKMPTRFVTVRERPSRYVLVIDTSASMTYRLQVLRQACYIFIHQVLLPEESLAIVEFNDDAAILQELTVVGERDRQALVRSLPNRAEGSTSIAAGVLKALEVLNRDSKLDDFGGRLIVLTDGQETEAPFIKDIINQTDSVLIHTIAIGDDVADDLETLANRAGGQQFLHQDASTALFDIFSQFGVESRGANSEELVSRYLPKFGPREISTITFVRDNTLRGGIIIYLGVISSATNTTFGGRRALDVHLTSPSNITTNSEYDNLVSIYTLSTTSSEDGVWTLTIRNLDLINLNISILVLAETEERQVDRPANLPITSTGLWAAADINPPQVQTAYLTLARGYNPVIDPEVSAIVETPMGIKNMTLYDDGIGEDITKGDGIYSGFFTQFTAPGRYSVQFSVRGTGRIVNGARVGLGAAVDPEMGDAEWEVQYEDAGEVQRTITGGSFTCNDMRTCRGGNKYGPYRVTNLVARNVNRENRTFDLVFSAPGADLMEGTANRYDIRFSTNFKSFMTEFTSGEPIGTVENDKRPYILQGNPNEPLEGRSEETFTIVLPTSEEQVVYFFALTAEDQLFKSPPSNLVSVSATGGTFPPPPIAPSTKAPLVMSTEKPDDSFLLPIVGAALFLLLLLLLILLLLLLLLRQRKKEKEHDNKALAIKDEEYILGSSKENGTTIRESNHIYDTDLGEDVTKGTAILSNGGHSNRHRRGQGDVDNDPYLEAHRSGDGQYTPNGHPNAHLAGQPTRGMDSRRDAERFSYPNGGFDHSGHSNIHGGLDSDVVRKAEWESNYNFLPGNAHSFSEPRVQQAGIVNSPGGDYTFLPTDVQQAEKLRQATFVENPGDYNFLPAEATEYGALRVANIEYNEGDYNDGQEGRVKSLANNLGSVLFQGGGNPRV